MNRVRVVLALFIVGLSRVAPAAYGQPWQFSRARASTLFHKSSDYRATRATGFKPAAQIVAKLVKHDAGDVAHTLPVLSPVPADAVIVLAVRDMAEVLAAIKRALEARGADRVTVGG